jgi:hypothetical protein
MRRVFVFQNLLSYFFATLSGNGPATALLNLCCSAHPAAASQMEVLARVILVEATVTIMPILGYEWIFGSLSMRRVPFM